MLFACALVLSTQTGHAAGVRRVAVTVDDLPAVSVPGGCSLPVLEQNTRRLLAALTRHRVPAIGFVNEGRLCEDLPGGSLDRLLEIWLDAGMDLGNHSSTHPDLNSTPLGRYQDDVVRGEAAVRTLLAKRGRRLRYFRHPFLHTGRDPETRRSFQAFLDARGILVAPVTLDNSDWMFAFAYSQALGRGDAAAARRVKDAYVPYMESIFEFFEKRSRQVVGREPAQVLLLHANALNADTFDLLARMMKRRGYAFVTLDEALKDPAYSLADTYSGPMGFSWLHRWGQGKGMPIVREPDEPAFITDIYRRFRTGD